jgi:hypothetical protein
MVLITDEGECAQSEYVSLMSSAKVLKSRDRKAAGVDCEVKSTVIEISSEGPMSFDADKTFEYRVPLSGRSVISVFVSSLW